MIVSVVLVTYNHERYLAQAIEGVLMQEGRFTLDLLITEDCSTDGTRAIVETYRQRYPDRIRTLLSPQNLNTNAVFTRALAQARGEYVAVLDGDDYWTARHKLQAQADFLDADPGFSMCFHNVLTVFEDGSAPPRPFNPPHQRRAATTADILRMNFIAGCSPMFRRSVLWPLPDWYDGALWGDWPLYILAGERGQIGYLPEIMGVYRRHAGGYWAGRTSFERLTAVISFYDHVDRSTGFRHHAVIRHAIVRRYLRAGNKYLNNGAVSEAKHCLRRCLTRLPPRPEAWKSWLRLALRVHAGPLYRAVRGAAA